MKVFKIIVLYGIFIVISLGLLFQLLTAIAQTTPSGEVACLSMIPQVVEQKAPNFSLRDLKGATVKLSDFKGKVILLHFWATWCKPCVEEIPSLINLNKSIQDREFELVTISTDNNKKIVNEFFKNTLHHYFIT